MLIWLFFLVAMLPFVAVAGLAALAAFSVLYLNGVAPDRFESEDLRRQRGPVLPSTRIGAIELLLGFLVMLFVPIGLLKLGLVEITAAPGSPERLAVQGLGLVAALVFLVGVDRLRGGRGMLPWGGGKISRPVFAFFAMLPMMALVAIWNRHLVEGLLGGLIPGELVEGMHELQGGAFWMSLSIALLIGPALEELLFRGAVFAAAARMAQAGDRSPFFVAVVFPAVLFAVVHPPAAWIPILFLGLALGCVRLHGHGIRDCIILHAAYNFVAFLLTYPAS